MIKDRIARPEANSVRELKRGDGMIIGSRFKPTGEVIAGPAEEALTPI